MRDLLPTVNYDVGVLEDHEELVEGEDRTNRVQDKFGYALAGNISCYKVIDLMTTPQSLVNNVPEAESYRYTSKRISRTQEPSIYEPAIPHLR